jgi:hypothetical protein
LRTYSDALKVRSMTNAMWPKPPDIQRETFALRLPEERTLARPYARDLRRVI